MLPDIQNHLILFHIHHNPLIRNTMSFHLSARDIRLEDGHILFASLQSFDGEWVDSQLDLDYYLGNNEGLFEWGGQSTSPLLDADECAICQVTYLCMIDFSHSANDITFSIEGGDNVPVLRASLSDSEGNGNERDVNLSERIGNDNGVLIFRGHPSPCCINGGADDI